MNNLIQTLDLFYTKVNEVNIILHKDIKDDDILIVNDLRMIHIIDRNDIVYINNRKEYISFSRTKSTEYFERYLKLDYWNTEKAIYPYISIKNYDEMDTEPCKEIKIKNRFISRENLNILYIIRLEKRDNKYYICYYVKNKLLENIKHGKREYILKELLCNIERENLLYNKNKELEFLMKPRQHDITLYDINIDEYRILNKDYKLYKYQENDVKWMKYIENNVQTNKNIISFDYSTIQSILDDNFVLINDTLLPSELINKNSYINSKLFYYGGNLTSEVGLGKTLTTLYHIFTDPIYVKKREEYNKFYDFSQSCNYFFKRGLKRGLSCDNICKDNSLYCDKHIDTLFIDKRQLLYKNLNEFNPSNFICSINQKINTNSTLIICPNHLCDQWAREYYDKFKNDKHVILLITKDQFNNLTLADILFSDIVITSYNILSSKWYSDLLETNDFCINNFKLNEKLPGEKEELVELFLGKKEFNELSLFNWNRIILDEAHELQNMNKNNFLKHLITKKFVSKFRWNITGTPFSKGLRGYLNLMSYNTSFNLTYNNVESLSLYDLLNYKLKSNIIKDSFTLFKRNTKQSVENELKKNIISQYIKLLDFTDEERSIYTSYEKGSKNKFSEFLIKLCCHSELNYDTKLIIRKCKTLNEIKDALLTYNEEELINLNKKKYDIQKQLDNSIINLEIIEEMEQYDDTIIEFHKIKIGNYKRQITNINKSIECIERTYNYLKNSIESSDTETCTICLETINNNNKTITKCGHKYCWECIISIFNVNSRYSTKEKKCPNCNTLLLIDDLYSYKTLEKSKTELNQIINDVKSTKIGNIIYFLKNLLDKKDKENDDKIIIFSQWDFLLDKVENILREYDLNIINCKGTVYQKKKAIKQFVNNKENRIIMLSSRNAASGINLIVANKIILLEPVYGNKEYRVNIENQAIGRSDRIGQNKPIEVYKFIIKDTIEEDIINNNVKEDDIPHINFN
jgi:SNF2 family DNA or RNA helicase